MERIEFSFKHIKNSVTSLLQEINKMQFNKVLDVWVGGTIIHTLMYQYDSFKFYQTGTAKRLTLYPQDISNQDFSHFAISYNDNILLVLDKIKTGETIKTILEEIRKANKTCKIAVVCLVLQNQFYHRGWIAETEYDGLTKIFNVIETGNELLVFPWQQLTEEERLRIPIKKRKMMNDPESNNFFDWFGVEDLRDQTTVKDRVMARQSKASEERRRDWEHKIREFAERGKQ